MTNKFKHTEVGTQLSETEYDADNAHTFESQEIGDIPYASGAAEISGLPHGTVGQPLVSGGHAAAPSWGYMPNRNAIINGAMDIWQRGTATLTFPANLTYFPDRFKIQHGLGDGTFDLLQSAETVSATFPFQYSLKLDCTHIETAVAAGEYCVFLYIVEGYDFKRFEGQTATLTFWFKAVKAGVYCVAFRNNAGDKSYVHEFTVADANWNQYTCTLTFNSGGTFLYTNGGGLEIRWTMLCGSTRQIATANKDTWQSGSYFATDAQVNGLDNTDNNFWLVGVRLELGSVATPFEFRPYGQELALCQRYYEKNMNQAFSPGFGGDGGEMAILAGDTTYLTGAYFKVAKRTIPTVTLYSRSGTVAKVNDLLSGQDRGTICTAYAPYIGETCFTHISDSGAGFIALTVYQYYFTASCEL